MATSFVYDLRGLLTSVTQDAGGPNAAITRYEYDEFGNCTRQIDANNHTTQFRYDLLGRRTERILMGNLREGFGYDASGNMVYHTNFNGIVITNQYDCGNRLTNKTSAGGYHIGFTFNTYGLRQTMMRSGLEAGEKGSC